MVTETENLKNMERCPRFQACSIPKCPLDFYMKDRVEMAEDERCPLMKIMGGTRSKRVKGSISAKMRGISSFIYKKNKS